MPRVVDHQQRRREIAAAVWKLAASKGLESVTMRQVAATAGVSLRQVQYYFGNRDQLLLQSLRLLNERSTESARARIEPAADSMGPKELARAILLESMPLDAQRREQLLVHIAYFVRALSDDALAAALRTPDGVDAGELELLLAGLIDEGAASGPLPAGAALKEAEMLLALAFSIGADTLAGLRTIEQALATLDHQLDRLFG
ncbi:TetR family transcriptional regulator [Nakamurella aerolata]|uniref:TetR family transcriptional regulator n=1 Tax=Nakamurella aerolata TaxID=1656892 RepID=A0A849AB61_9ACTN|nr:TetR family transcriptional regulator [Nakamurella aerolata]